MIIRDQREKEKVYKNIYISNNWRISWAVNLALLLITPSPMAPLMRRA
jgi:hypothetical protein